MRQEINSPEIKAKLEPLFSRLYDLNNALINFNESLTTDLNLLSCIISLVDNHEISPAEVLEYINGIELRGTRLKQNLNNLIEIKKEIVKCVHPNEDLEVARMEFLVFDGETDEVIEGPGDLASDDIELIAQRNSELLEKIALVKSKISAKSRLV